jgi:hypothetical protein
VANGRRGGGLGRLGLGARGAPSADVQGAWPKRRPGSWLGLARRLGCGRRGAARPWAAVPWLGTQRSAGARRLPGGGMQGGGR